MTRKKTGDLPKLPRRVFVLSAMVVLLIAFVSVSSQTLRTAFTKPAETLKYE